MNTKQEEALREYLKEAIVPLIEQVLVKKLGQAMSFAASELVQPQRKWIGLTDEEIADCAEKMEASDPTDSFWREFFRGIEAKLKEKNT
jgi:hypothetical protein